MRKAPIVALLILLAFVIDSEVGAEAPYESFPAPDFTRGERGDVGEFSIGMYTHFRRFDALISGSKRVANTRDIHHERWIPALILDYRFTERFAVSVKAHGASIRTNLLDNDLVTRRINNTTIPGDVFVYGIWHPWLEKDPNAPYSFWDRRNLGFVAGPKFDFDREDPQVGVAPGADFRHGPFGAGSNEALAGFVYTGHINDKIWLYHYSQYLIPLDRNVFGMKPGERYESQLLGISYLPNDVVQLFCSVNAGYEWSGSGGRIASAPANTGGTKVFLNPGITADFAHGWGTEISVNYPLYGNLHGIQLEGREDLFFGFYKTF